MDESARRTRVEWHEWGRDPFEIAARDEEPLLLSLSATWCDSCHEMDRATYDDPRIAANVNDRFVPVRVDVDRHPRARERYNAGSFPSTTFVTPSGTILASAGYLDSDAMGGVLDRVRETWNTEGEAAGRVPRGLRDEEPPRGELTPTIEATIAGRLEATYDPEYGGWGTDAKFPLPEAVEFALKRDREAAIRTLSGIRTGLFDDYEGGFFRLATTRSWERPRREKLLDSNAALLRAFANGYLYTGDEGFRDVADRTIGYLTTTLWTGAGFAGSQAPSEAGSATERESEGEPLIDSTVFADRNALAAEALLTYHAYTDDERAARYAERALDALAELQDGDALVHYRDGSETGDGSEIGTRGLLSDHARAVEALTTAAGVLGDDGYVDRARTLAEFVLDARREDGLFLDGPSDGPGMAGRPLRPLDDTVVMADALIDLTVLTGEERYRDAAHEALSAFAGAADRFGPPVARYGSVVSRLLDGPLTIEVSASVGSDLHRAALRVADHEKVVIVEGAKQREEEPIDDGELTKEDTTEETAYVRNQDIEAGPATTPDELSDAVATVVEASE